jgi:hypothetical protein
MVRGQLEILDEMIAALEGEVRATQKMVEDMDKVIVGLSGPGNSRRLTEKPHLEIDKTHHTNKPAPPASAHNMIANPPLGGTRNPDIRPI